jgi:hypothetical protein
LPIIVKLIYVDVVVEFVCIIGVIGVIIEFVFWFVFWFVFEL